jgi:hypothetical protein
MATSAERRDGVSVKLVAQWIERSLATKIQRSEEFKRRPLSCLKNCTVPDTLLIPWRGG